jgi:hypothetical protein
LSDNDLLKNRETSTSYNFFLDAVKYFVSLLKNSITFRSEGVVEDDDNYAAFDERSNNVCAVVLAESFPVASVDVDDDRGI